MSSPSKKTAAPASASSKSLAKEKEEKQQTSPAAPAPAAASSSAAATNESTAAPSASEEDDAVCEICFSGDIEEDNLIVFCDGTGADGKPCTAVVHQYCYGVFIIPEGDDPWFCDMCAVKRGLRPNIHPNLKKTVDRCQLCPSVTGAFKPSHDNSGWCHAACVVWIPETGFYDPRTMEDVIGVDAIERSRFTLKCELCTERTGACIQCMAHACRYSFHPRCGGSHREQIKMDMEAVSVGSTFDVLKLVYCPKHRYLGDDPLEKQILIKKWRMTGRLDDGPDEPTGEKRKRKVLTKPGQRGKKRRKKNADGSSDDDDDDDAEDGENGHDQRSTGIDDDVSSSSSASDGSEVDDDGRRIRKRSAYMCADCGSIKRTHKCPFGNKKKSTTKRRKASCDDEEDANEDGPSVDQFVVRNPFPNMWFPSTSTLERKRWRDDETDSDCESVDIKNDSDLDQLYAQAKEEARLAAGKRERDELESYRPPPPKLKTQTPATPKKLKSAATTPTVKRAPPTTAPSQSHHSHYANIDPKALTPDMVTILLDQMRQNYERQALQQRILQQQVAAQQNGTPFDTQAAHATMMQSLASALQPSPAMPSTNNQQAAFTFQQLQQQQQLQLHFMRFAQEQAQQQAQQQQLQQMQANNSPGAPHIAAPIPIPSFLSSPAEYQATLTAFVEQQRAAELQRFQQQAARAREGDELRARQRAEAKIAAKLLKTKEKDALREQTIKLKQEEKETKKSAAAAMRAANNKTVVPRKSSSSIKLPTNPTLMQLLTPSDEAKLKERFLRLSAASQSKDRLQLLNESFLSPPQPQDANFMRIMFTRFIQEQKGLDLLRKWIESSIIIVSAASTIEKQNKAKMALAGDGTNGSSATPLPVTPATLGADLIVACLNSISRINDVVEISRLPTFPASYQLVTRLAQHEQQRIREAARALRAKLPNPITPVAVTTNPNAPATMQQQQQRVIPKMSTPNQSLSLSLPMNNQQQRPGAGPRPLTSQHSHMQQLQQQQLQHQQHQQQQQLLAKQHLDAAIAQRIHSTTNQSSTPQQRDQRRNPYQPQPQSQQHQQQMYQQQQQQQQMYQQQQGYPQQQPQQPPFNQPQISQQLPIPPPPPQSYQPPYQPLQTDDYYSENVEEQQPPQQPVAPVSNALSALSAMLNVPSEAAPAAATPTVDVSQLSQWLNKKLDGGASAAAPVNDTSSKLAALLAKVSGGASTSLPTPPQPQQSPNIQAQLTELQSHEAHWNDQYRVLWTQHDSTLRQVISIQQLPNMLEKLQRSSELLQLEQHAHQLADQLRQVQANQAEVKAKLAKVHEQLSAQQLAQPSVDPRTLLLTGLSPSTTEPSLRQLFSHFGTLLSIQLINNPATGRSEEYAYATYATIDQSMKVKMMAEQRQISLDGRIIDVRFAAAQAQQQQSNAMAAMYNY